MPDRPDIPEEAVEAAVYWKKRAEDLEYQLEQARGKRDELRRTAESVAATEASLALAISRYERETHLTWNAVNGTERERLVEAARLDLQAAAPALRKQGAEEAEKLRGELAQARSNLRYHEHHERKAIEELDDLGVEKFDSEDRMDSTDDSAGQEWSIYMRIRLLAGKLRREGRAERDQALAKGAEEERERLREALEAIEPQHEHLISRAAVLAALDTPAPSEGTRGHTR